MEGRMEGQVQCRRREGGGTDRGREGGMEGGMERDLDFNSPECFGHYPGPILILFFMVTLASYMYCSCVMSSLHTAHTDNV